MKALGRLYYLVTVVSLDYSMREPFEGHKRKVLNDDTIIYLNVSEKGIQTYHREDGPAVIAPRSRNGSAYLMWMQNDKLHRFDGPAYVTEDTKEYWLNEKQIHEEEFIMLYEVSFLKEYVEQSCEHWFL
jgi:hypothetical protein